MIRISGRPHAIPVDRDTLQGATLPDTLKSYARLRSCSSSLSRSSPTAPSSTGSLDVDIRGRRAARCGLTRDPFRAFPRALRCESRAPRPNALQRRPKTEPLNVRCGHAARETCTEHCALCGWHCFVGAVVEPTRKFPSTPECLHEASDTKPLRTSPLTHNTPHTHMGKQKDKGERLQVETDCVDIMRCAEPETRPASSLSVRREPTREGAWNTT